MLQSQVERLRTGDQQARDELLAAASGRLLALTRRMKKGFPRVGRWEQTDDVFQDAAMRLCRALETVEVADARHFLRLAATQIRRELIDLTRQLNGPHGVGSNHQTRDRSTDGDDSIGMEAGDHSDEGPQKMQNWSDLHEAIERLPEAEREVVELLWYHGLTQEMAAETLEVSPRTVRRHWRSARLKLHDEVAEDLLS